MSNPFHKSKKYEMKFGYAHALDTAQSNLTLSCISEIFCVVNQEIIVLWMFQFVKWFE